MPNQALSFLHAASASNKNIAQRYAKSWIGKATDWIGLLDVPQGGTTFILWKVPEHTILPKGCQQQHWKLGHKNMCREPAAVTLKCANKGWHYTFPSSAGAHGET